MNKDEALRMALEFANDIQCGRYKGNSEEIITACDQALAAQPVPVQEPVAWPCLIDSADFSENTITLVMQCEDYKVSAGTHYLSTTPPQRKPLTDEEVVEVLGNLRERITGNVFLAFARAIEAAHGIKEKNT